MSSSEPPSRLPPRGLNPDTKAQRDELSSKGKVEKVREVDADEARKQKKWRAAYYDEEQPVDTTTDPTTNRRPSLFDLSAQTPVSEEGPLSSSNQSGLSDVEDAIVPSPAYSPPPFVSLGSGEEDEEDDATAGALPQSNDFWEDVDFPPEQPLNPTSFQEMPQSNNQGVEAKNQKGKEGPTTASAQAEGKKSSHGQTASAKKKEASPFGPPGKPMQGLKETPEKETGIPSKSMEKKEAPKQKTPEEMKKVPSLFEEAAKTEKKQYEGPSRELKKSEKNSAKEKEAEESSVQGINAMPMRTEDREGGGGQRGKQHKSTEIQISSLPAFPSGIQNAAAIATNQATPYLHPSTASLFFQMVGTMYVMSGPQGVMRTEIVLNNPAYATSRFFGSTISIEKYATAPDSFNITLTGSDDAVTAFRDNIPSLMAAFQQGNFAFKVNRLDVSYSLERPVFRRKEKGEDQGGGAGGSDLGERKK